MFSLFAVFFDLGLKYCPAFFKGGIMNIQMLIEKLKCKYETKTGIEPSVLYLGQNEFFDLMTWIDAQPGVKVTDPKQGYDKMIFCELKVIRVFLDSHLNVC